MIGTSHLLNEYGYLSILLCFSKQCFGRKHCGKVSKKFIGNSLFFLRNHINGTDTVKNIKLDLEEFLAGESFISRMHDQGIYPNKMHVRYVVEFSDS